MTAALTLQGVEDGRHVAFCLATADREELMLRRLGCDVVQGFGVGAADGRRRAGVLADRPA